jgi:hypothetical protein
MRLAARFRWILLRPPHWLTQALPLKQVQAPQAPIAQVFGKSAVLVQHRAVMTVPPEPRRPVPV